MLSRKEINDAVKTWLSYADSDKYDEDKAREVIKARITIREALRSGCIILDPRTFRASSATECFTAVRNAMEEMHNGK